LPVALHAREGTLRAEPADGGLVSALDPVVRRRLGGASKACAWIGWAGVTGVDERDLRAALDRAALEQRGPGPCLVPVPLSSEERDAFYRGFSNEILWPLFHDLPSLCHFEPAYWEAYVRVNRRFAESIATMLLALKGNPAAPATGSPSPRTAPQNASALQGGRRAAATASLDADAQDALVWVHDYHLMLVGAELRRMGFAQRIGFFLHTPFPEARGFRKLPWRERIARSLLAYDLIGVQTERDLAAMARTLEESARAERLPNPIANGGNSSTPRDLAWSLASGLVPLDLPREPNLPREPSPLRSLGAASSLGPHRPLQPTHRFRAPGASRVVELGVFPIGLDFDAEERAAQSPIALAAKRRLELDQPAQILVLGVDRLDYTKGIPQRLMAFREMFARHPELRGRVTLLQLVVPSREEIPSYASLRDEIERLVGQINGTLAHPGWTPVLYLHHPLGREELRGWYQAAHVALVTPIEDGMNLVAKEYCASRIDERGVLVLSERAGAATQLAEGALLVNPNDRLAVADAIARACLMRPDEQAARMKRLRARVRREDVHAWAGAFLDQLAAAPATLAATSAAPSARRELPPLRGARTPRTGTS
jgi:trehalose 6-phosphate synthase